jgi:hypothetical protein
VLGFRGPATRRFDTKRCQQNEAQKLQELGRLDVNGQFHALTDSASGNNCGTRISSAASELGLDFPVSRESKYPALVGCCMVEPRARFDRELPAAARLPI